MSSNPRTQAEAASFFKRQEKELQDKRLFESESATLEFLHWAELPITKKILKKYEQTYKNFQDHFESQKWQNEAEARGLAYSMRFLGVLEKLVESYKDKYKKIQAAKQRGTK